MTSAPSFRLLPVEPTEAMQANGRDAIQPWLPQGRIAKPVTDQWQIAREVWSSMVSAAPVMAEATPWLPISSAPKDGQIIWAWLFDTGIRAVRWVSAEEHAERLGDDPDDYEAGWTEVNDDTQDWTPKWWMPYGAIPEPPDPPAPLVQKGKESGE